MVTGSSMRRTLSSGLSRSTIIRIELFLALNLADFILTCIMTQLKLGIEGNLLLRLFPLWGVGLMKLGVALLVIRYLGNKVAIMRLLNVGMGLVAVWNLTWFILLC